jgi:hypothetical protein
VTIETLSTPPQAAGSTGGLPGGGSTSGSPAGNVDQFAALVAQLVGADRTLPSSTTDNIPVADGEHNIAIPQAPADVVLGLVEQNRGSGQTRSRSGSAKTTGDVVAEPPAAEDQIADATTSVVVPVFVWTLAGPGPEVGAGVAPSAPDVAPSDAHDAAPLAAQMSDRPQSIPALDAPASTSVGSHPKPTVQDSRADGFSPSGPDRANAVAENPAVHAGTVPEPAADSAQVVAPAGKVNQAAVPSNDPVSAPEVHGASPAVGNAIRSRDLTAPTPTSASSQPAANVAREADGAVAPPVAAVREGSAGGSADASSDHAGRGNAPPPPPIDAAPSAGPIRNDHGHAPVAEPVAAVTVVAAPQPGAGSAVPLQHTTEIHAAAVPDDGDVRRQIVQAIRMQWTDGVGTARLTLQPEYLGEVTISLHVEQGGVTAHLNADSSEVRSWMSANEAVLRQGLSEHGLTLDRLIVSDEPAEFRTGDDGRRQPQRQPQEDDTPSPRRQRDTGTFEITV